MSHTLHDIDQDGIGWVGGWSGLGARCGLRVARPIASQHLFRFFLALVGWWAVHSLLLGLENLVS